MHTEETHEFDMKLNILIIELFSLCNRTSVKEVKLITATVKRLRANAVCNITLDAVQIF